MLVEIFCFLKKNLFEADERRMKRNKEE